MAKELILDRCPYCNIAKPFMAHISSHMIAKEHEVLLHILDIYECSSCHNFIIHKQIPKIYFGDTEFISLIIPKEKTYDKNIPDKARNDLTAAYETLHQPKASIIMSSRAVETMLQIKGYNDNYLNDKIIAAHGAGILTDDMKKWADEVRLDANKERHAALADNPPSKEDAERTLSFAETIAEILFVIPSKVTRGISASSQGGQTPTGQAPASGNTP